MLLVAKCGVYATGLKYGNLFIAVFVALNVNVISTKKHTWKERQTFIVNSQQYEHKTKSKTRENHVNASSLFCLLVRPLESEYSRSSADKWIRRKTDELLSVHSALEHFQTNVKVNRAAWILLNGKQNL